MTVGSGVAGKAIALGLFLINCISSMCDKVDEP